MLNNVGFLNAMRDRVIGENPMPQNQTMLNQLYSTYIGRKFKILNSHSELEKEKFKMHDVGQSTL